MRAVLGSEWSRAVTACVGAQVDVRLHRKCEHATHSWDP